MNEMENGGRRVLVPMTLPNSTNQGYAVLQFVGFSQSPIPSPTAACPPSSTTGPTLLWSPALPQGMLQNEPNGNTNGAGAIDGNNKEKRIRPPISPTPLRSPTNPSPSMHKKPSGSGVESPPPQAEVDKTQQVPTTFVQADTNSFKEVVQKLTGASDDSQEKLPITMPARYSGRSPAVGEAAAPGKQEGIHTKQNPTNPVAQNQSFGGAGNKPGIEVGPRKPTFKLHERRQNLRKLQISFGLNSLRHNPPNGLSPRAPDVLSPSMLDLPALVLSPVTPLGSDPFDCPSNSNSCNESSMSAISQEEKAIAEKGFYLHPSPLHTPRSCEPELLPLFPVHSPRESSS